MQVDITIIIVGVCAAFIVWWREIRSTAVDRRLEISPAQYVELEKQYQRALAALHFWLPHPPDDGPDHVADRVWNDAMLLVDFDAVATAEPDAETLGWIKLMNGAEKPVLSLKRQ